MEDNSYVNPIRAFSNEVEEQLDCETEEVCDDVIERQDVQDVIVGSYNRGDKSSSVAKRLKNQYFAKGGKTKDKFYMLNSFYVYVHQDSYEEGEGDEISSWDSHDTGQSGSEFSSKKDLMDFSKFIIRRDVSNADAKDDDFFIQTEDGETTMSYSVLAKYHKDFGKSSDYPGHSFYGEATDEEIDRWKKGEEELFSVMFLFKVSTYTQEEARFAKGGYVVKTYKDENDLDGDFDEVYDTEEEAIKEARKLKKKHYMVEVDDIDNEGLIFNINKDGDEEFFAKGGYVLPKYIKERIDKLKKQFENEDISETQRDDLLYGIKDDYDLNDEQLDEVYVYADIYAKGGKTKYEGGEITGFYNEYGSAYQDEVEDAVRDLTSEQYEAFCYAYNVDPNNANEMSDFIADLNQEEAADIMTHIRTTGELEDRMKGMGYAKGGEVSIEEQAKKLIKKSIKWRWRQTDMGSGYEFSLIDPIDGDLLEEQSYLDIYEGDGDYDAWKEESFEYGKEAFTQKLLADKELVDDFTEHILQALSYDSHYAKGGDTKSDKMSEKELDELAWDDVNSWSSDEIAEFLDLGEDEDGSDYMNEAVDKWKEDLREQGYAKGGKTEDYRFDEDGMPAFSSYWLERIDRADDDNLIAEEDYIETKEDALNQFNDLVNEYGETNDIILYYYNKKYDDDEQIKIHNKTKEIYLVQEFYGGPHGNADDFEEYIELDDEQKINKSEAIEKAKETFDYDGDYLDRVEVQDEVGDIVFSVSHDNPKGQIYAKGGMAEGYSKFKVLYIPYSGKTQEKMFDFYSEAYKYYDELVDDERGGGTTTIILQGYTDEYNEFEDIFYFDPMEMEEQDDDFAKGGKIITKSKWEKGTQKDRENALKKTSFSSKYAQFDEWEEVPTSVRNYLTKGYLISDTGEKYGWYGKKYAKGGLTRRGKVLSEDELWDMIESYDWIEDGDYKRIGKKVKKLSKNQYLQLLGFATAKHRLLDEKYSKGIQGYVSDDGWDDVRAEVVGRGKDYYNNITIKELQDMSYGDYNENFLYSFQDHKGYDDWTLLDNAIGRYYLTNYVEIWY